MKQKNLTTAAGVPVADNQNSLTSGREVRCYCKGIAAALGIPLSEVK